MLGVLLDKVLKFDFKRLFLPQKYAAYKNSSKETIMVANQVDNGSQSLNADCKGQYATSYKRFQAMLLLESLFNIVILSLKYTTFSRRIQFILSQVHRLLSRILRL